MTQGPLHSSKAGYSSSKGCGSVSLPPLLLLGLLFLSLLISLTVIGADSVRLSKAYIAELSHRYGPEAGERLTEWQQLIQDLADQPESEKLYWVNRFFNKVRFLNDIDHWKKEDYWATPVEFLVSNGGDCEDFSIAKYYTLRELGVADKKLSIAYVKALDYNQAHMVLTYYESPRSVPLVLDNLVPKIKPVSARKDLRHVYSFNGDNLWLSKKGRRSKLVGTSDRLGPWVKVKSRIGNQQVNLQ
ncbi:transglutaminase-like cysteine peptidase [Marinobacterium jannaschii]|uniref:transglutaminase-like cysteine peptidase n=1 Tax=Marinobacterium jannaschii TaxID=64970 RepID=UPI002ADDB557|nr:transglutaminase-like cysteine peptidase [Marinobacterium jannaschii]